MIPQFLVLACLVAQNSPPADSDAMAGGPYCGIYSFYAALKAHGREVALQDLCSGTRFDSGPTENS